MLRTLAAVSARTLARPGRPYAARRPNLVISQLEPREHPGGLLGMDDDWLTGWYGAASVSWVASGGTDTPPASTPPSGSETGGSGTGETPPGTGGQTAESPATYFSGVPVRPEEEFDFVAYDPNQGGQSGTGEGGTGGTAGGGPGATADAWAGLSDPGPSEQPPSGGTSDPAADLPPSGAPPEPTVAVGDLPEDLALAYTDAGTPEGVIEVGAAAAPPPDVSPEAFALTDPAPSDGVPSPPPGTPTPTDPTDPNQTSGTGGSGPSPSDPTAPGAPTGGSPAPAAQGGMWVTSGGYARHYTHSGSNSVGAAFSDVTVTGTVVMGTGPDGQPAAYEQVRVDYHGWNRTGSETTPYSGWYTSGPTPIWGGNGYNFVGLTATGTPVLGYGSFTPPALEGWTTEGWTDELRSGWGGEYRAANGVTYQFAQTYAGTAWWAAEFTSTQLDDGNHQIVTQRDWGGAFRSDFSSSDQAGNFPPAPAAAGPVDTALPADLFAAPATGSTFVERGFDAGAYDGSSRHEAIWSADGTQILRHPDTGHIESTGTTGNRYFFQNAYQVGDRANAANPAEDRHAWLIDYQDTGTYGYTQDWDLPNEGTMFNAGTRTTEQTASRTITRDVYDVRSTFHRAKDGSVADGSLRWRRAADGPVTSTVTDHFEETFDNTIAGLAASRKVDTESNGRYALTTTARADYTLVNRDAAGQRTGETKGGAYVFAVNIAGGHDRVSATYDFGTAAGTVDMEQTGTGSTAYLNRASVVTTVDGVAASGTAITFAAGSGTTGVTTRTQGDVNAAGDQQTGTYFDEEKASGGSIGWTWSQSARPGSPTSTSQMSVTDLTSGLWTTDLTITDGQSNGTIQGRTDFTRKVNGTDTTVGTHVYTGVGPVPRPVAPEGTLASLPPFPTTPTRLAVNDRRQVTGAQGVSVRADLTFQGGLATGEVYEITTDGATTDYTLDRRATREDGELDVKSRASGKVTRQTTDTVSSAYAAGQVTTVRGLVFRQTEDSTARAAAEGRVRGVGGWYRDWSLTTSDFASPERLPVTGRDTSPVAGPIPAANRGPDTSRHVDTTVRVTFAPTESGWEETDRHFDAVVAERGGFRYEQNDDTLERPDGTRAKQTVRARQATDSVVEVHGTAANYTYSVDRRGLRTGSQVGENTWSAVAPAPEESRSHTISASAVSGFDVHEKGRMSNGQRAFDQVNSYSYEGTRKLDTAIIKTPTQDRGTSFDGQWMKEEVRTGTAAAGTGYRRERAVWDRKEFEVPHGQPPAWTTVDHGGSWEWTTNSLNWPQTAQQEFTLLGTIRQDILNEIKNQPAGYQILLGTAEAVAGLACGGIPGLQGLGVGLWITGIDQIVGGAASLSTGTTQPTPLQFAGSEVALALGASPQTAEFVGSLTPLAVALAFGGWGGGAGRAGTAAQERLLGYGLFGGRAKPPTGAFSEALKTRMMRAAESSWFRSKVGAWSRLNGLGPIDWPAFMQRLSQAEFREFASFGQGLSFGWSGLAPGGANWMFGVPRWFRRIRGVGGSTIQHELMHAVQDFRYGLFALDEAEIGFFRGLSIEAAAYAFGSPLLAPLPLAGGVFIMGGTGVLLYEVGSLIAHLNRLFG
jgi:hypothetical protein